MTYTMPSHAAASVTLLKFRTHLQMVGPCWCASEELAKDVEPVLKHEHWCRAGGEMSL
jgi:hypothetical protein